MAAPLVIKKNKFIFPAIFFVSGRQKSPVKKSSPYHIVAVVQNTGPCQKKSKKIQKNKSGVLDYRCYMVGRRFFHRTFVKSGFLTIGGIWWL